MELGEVWKLSMVDDFSFGPICHGEVKMLFDFDIYVAFDYSGAGLEFVDDTWAGG